PRGCAASREAPHPAASGGQGVSERLAEEAGAASDEDLHASQCRARADRFCLKRLSGNPLPQQRIDDQIPVLLSINDVVSQERRERGLDRGWPSETMARAHVTRQQLASVLKHDSA